MTLIDFNNNVVLFCLYIFFCLNRKKCKKVLKYDLILHAAVGELIYISKDKILRQMI